MPTPRFNLLAEPCVPIEGRDMVSLLEVFADATIPGLGGTPVRKIAFLKLLLAIAQAATTPADMDEWEELGPDGLADRCTAYLNEQRDNFWLYGPRPFLQMPACIKAEPKSFALIKPEVATTNTTLLTQIQRERELDDAEKFQLLVEQMSFSFGGKKPFQKLVLSPGYEKKSARPGPGICSKGLLHTFLMGKTLRETLWFNLLTQEDISGQKQWTSGLGTAPWEKMPAGEACPVAEDIKTSLMGRLVPLSRFCLFTDEGLKFTSGIDHPDHTAGMTDPSASIDMSKDKPRMLWVNPEKRPWRQLPALLSFLDAESKDSFFCLGLRKSIEKVREMDGDRMVCIWSGGIKVSTNAGEQYLTGRDDLMESTVWFPLSFTGYLPFRTFSSAMQKLENMSAHLYAKTIEYFRQVGRDKIQDMAAEATCRFWQMVESTQSELIRACNQNDKDWTEDALKALYRKYYGMVLTVYDDICMNDTARQFEIWARNRPFARREHE